jgi:hypothetical protein
MLDIETRVGNMELLPGNDLTEEERDALALEIGMSAVRVLNYILLQHFGQLAVEDLQHRSVNRLHDLFFLRALPRLGLDREASDAIRCAKYHVLSNQIGGQNVAYAEESPKKAWVFYRTLTFGGSPTTPLETFGLGNMSFRPEWMFAQFRTWHSRNGSSLGNPKIGWVMTHNIQHGDPYDAGYFYEAERPLVPSERFQVRFEDELPADVPMVRIDIDPSAGWTPERRTKARRNYPPVYFREMQTDIRETYSAATAGKLVELSMRSVLFHHVERHARLLGLADLADPRGTALLAGVIARVLSAFGDEVVVETKGDSYTLQAASFRLFKDDVEPEVRAGFDRALAALQRYRFPRCVVTRANSSERWGYRIAPD